jgi:hypothetical protein
MESVSLDVHSPETFSEFCSEYGSDPDSISQRKLFRRCRKHARMLREFFTEDQIEKLSSYEW